MTSSGPAGARRRRGRPSASDAEDRRKGILEAASAEFDEHGYDGASMRSVARRAGVDASLLHHYFGSKADMFAEAIGFPARPDQALARLLAGGPSGVGEPLVRWLLQTWDDPAVQKRGTSILRAALGNKVVTPVVVQFLRREVLGKIAGSLSTDDAGLRSELVASQVIGMLIGRYVVRLPTLRDAGPELLVEWYGPTIQRYLDGASPRGDANRS